MFGLKHRTTVAREPAWALKFHISVAPGAHTLAGSNKGETECGVAWDSALPQAPSTRSRSRARHEESSQRVKERQRIAQSHAILTATKFSRTRTISAISALERTEISRPEPVENRELRRTALPYGSKVSGQRGPRRADACRIKRE